MRMLSRIEKLSGKEGDGRMDEQLCRWNVIGSKQASKQASSLWDAKKVEGRWMGNGEQRLLFIRLLFSTKDGTFPTGKLQYNVSKVCVLSWFSHKSISHINWEM